MKKSFLIIAISIFSNLVADAQTIKENIDKAIKDPKRIENEAKADVYIHQKKTVDSIKAKDLNTAKTSKKKKCKKSK